VEWSNNSVVISGNPITVNAAGTYTCTFQDPSNGCSSQQTIVISIDTLSPIISLSTDNDTLNCAQTFADLFSISNMNSAYSWTGPSGFSSSLQNPGTVNVSGTYNLQVTDLINGCTSNASIFIDSIPNPIASFIADPSIGTAPLTVNFTNTSSNGFNSYDWNFGNLSGSTLTNPSNLYSDPGTYTVTLIGYGATNACNDTVTAEIIVYPEATVIIPNVFTPNGDSINDVFSFTTSGLRDLEADIFDRWGLRVGKIIGVNGFWDGSGSSAGTYYFVLVAKTLDGKEIKKNGYILLAK
jgi:gliding motility-associated-like protein